MKDVGIGEATGKIILMGEHAVVYGEPAIAFPFNGTKIVATLSESATATNTVTSSYHTGKLADTPDNLANIRALTARLQKEFGASAFHLQIDSTIPAERGMGSSAAVAVAITRAFFDWQDRPLTEEQLLFYVNFSEQIAHGNPSGIDAAATSGSQPIFFLKNKEIIPFPLHLDAYLLVADTGIKGQTRAAVKSVAELYEVDQAFTSNHLQQIGRLTRHAQHAIMSNHPQELGLLMTEAHLRLASLHVSNSELNNYIRLALAEGALGAKLTGGGRGGCFIVLTKSKDDAIRIGRKLKVAGVKDAWLQGLGVYQYA
ncbi:mevalonate kinase [Enterococcus camelliae]|uniref:Mevalonate kinase n=1 Tax=Enterococcus camelliae TaxID=453959 RepID=A0ABW5TM79_9ENTE